MKKIGFPINDGEAKTSVDNMLLWEPNVGKFHRDFPTIFTEGDCGVILTARLDIMFLPPDPELSNPLMLKLIFETFPATI